MIAWADTQRTAITFSREGAQDARLALDAVLAELTELGLGATARQGIGLWHGIRESAWTVELVGPVAVPDLARLVAAAHAEGCEAVQVERWAVQGYTAEEWRPDREREL